MVKGLKVLGLGSLRVFGFGFRAFTLQGFGLAGEGVGFSINVEPGFWDCWDLGFWGLQPW